MASIKFGIQFASTGASQTIAELLKIREAAKTIADQAPSVNLLASSLSITGQSAAKLATDVGRSPAEVNKLVESLKSMGAAGVSADRQILALSSNFGVTAEQATKLQRAVATNTGEQTKLSTSLGVGVDSAQKFSQAMGLSTSRSNELVGRFKELGNGSISTADKARILNKEFGISDEQFKVLTKTVGATKEGFAALGATAGAVAASLGAVASSGTQAFAKFDGQLRQFAVIGEASKEQVASVRAEIERLGTSTQKTPEEIATLSIELTKMGFKAGDVKDALGGMVLSSQATGESLARTGEVIGNVINQFTGNSNQLKLTAKDTTKIADLLTVASNETASGTSDLGEALSYVGTEANASNQSFKDTILSLGLLADAGIKGSSAGTGLAEALKRLKLSSAAASTELSELKSRGSKSAVAAFKLLEAGVRDASGQMRPMPEVIKNIKEGMATIESQADKDLISNALFGVQGGRIMNVLLSASNEKVDEFNKKLETGIGVSKKAGLALSEGPAAAMKQLEATTSVALIKVGEILQGPFSLLIGASQQLVSTFVQLPGPLQAAVVGTAGFAAVLAAATAAIAAYNFANGEKIVEDGIAAALQVKAIVLDSGRLASTLSLTAVTNGQSFATAAATVVEKIRTFELTKANAVILAQTVMTKGLALQTAVMTAASAAWAAVTSGALLPAIGTLLVTLAPVVITLGLVAAAIGAVTLALGKSPGAEFAQGVEGNTTKLKELREATTEPIKVKTDPTEVKDLVGYLEKLLDKVKERGPIEGVQASFQSAAAAADEFGSQTEVLTSTQRGNQRAMLALAEQSNETGKTVDAGRAILEKYGVAILDSGTKARIGAKNIDEFTAASKAQIKIIEDSIVILEEQKKSATTESQVTAIQNQINALEGSKKALQSRAATLNGDSEALKTNTDRTKEAAEAQKDLEDALKKIDDITKRESKGTATADQAVEQVKAAEAEAAAKKLSGEQLALLAEKSKEAIVKIRKAEISDIKKLLETGEINEKEAIDKLQAIRSKAGANTEAGKAAAKAILEIRKDEVDAEIAIIQAGIAEIDAARASGKLTEEQAEKATTALKQEEIRKRIALAEEEIALSSGAERTKAIANLRKLNADLEKEQAESSARILAIKIKKIEEENAKALALLKLAEQERSNEIQKGLNAGTTRQEQAQKDRLDNSRATLQKELDATKEAQQKLAELESEATTPKAREEFEKRKLEAATKTAGAIGKLLENEAQQQQFVRDRIIAGIDREQAKRSQAIDLQIAQMNKLQAVATAKATTSELASQKEIAGIERANNALTRQTQLLSAQAGLKKAQLDAELALAEKAGNPEQIAAVKLRIFQNEQAQALVTFQNQIKAEQFAQKRAEIEAKINELKAKQAVLTAQQAIAEANLTAAKAKGEADAALAKAQQLPQGEARDKAIADAKQQQALTAEQSAAQKAAAASGLEVAKQGADLAIEASKQVKAQGASLKEIQAIQQQTLKIEQETAKARFDSAAAIERQNEALAQQNATKPDGGAAIPAGRRGGGSVSGGTAYIVGEVEPEIFIPGVSGTILNQRQIEANLTQLLQVRSVAGLSPVSVSMPSVSVHSDPMAPLLAEIKALRQAVDARSPVVNMPVTFTAPDTNEWDSVLKIQRSNLRGML